MMFDLKKYRSDLSRKHGIALTQKDIARILDCNISTVCKVEQELRRAPKWMPLKAAEIWRKKKI